VNLFGITGTTVCPGRGGSLRSGPGATGWPVAGTDRGVSDDHLRPVSVGRPGVPSGR